VSPVTDAVLVIYGDKGVARNTTSRYGSYDPRRAPPLNSDQRELFQRISKKRPQSAGNLGSRDDRLQHSGVAEVVGCKEKSQMTPIYKV